MEIEKSNSETAVKEAMEERMKLEVVNAEVKEQFEAANEKLKETEASLSSAFKELDRKERKLELNVQMARREILEYKLK